MENKDLLKGMENASVYREMFLTRKMTGAMRQTYIDESLYETLTGISLMRRVIENLKK